MTTCGSGSASRPNRLALAEVSTLLDLGAGTGVLSPDLRRTLAPSARVFALDISHAMLREGADKPWHAGDLRIQATALALPLADASIELVLCFAAFPHFAECIAGADRDGAGDSSSGAGRDRAFDEPR